MNDDRSFCVASKNVYARKFDDEVVVLDTKSGLYFSLRESAVDIWSHVEAGASRRLIVEALVSRYEGDRTSIERAVDQSLGILLEDKLIREMLGYGAVSLDPCPPAARKPFAEPLIERFTDMQNLLLLDPIHEVSEEGWPEQPASTRRAEG